MAPLGAGMGAGTSGGTTTGAGAGVVRAGAHDAATVSAQQEKALKAELFISEIGLLERRKTSLSHTHG